MNAASPQCFYLEFGRLLNGTCSQDSAACHKSVSMSSTLGETAFMNIFCLHIQNREKIPYTANRRQDDVGNWFGLCNKYIGIPAV